MNDDAEMPVYCDAPDITSEVLVYSGAQYQLRDGYWYMYKKGRWQILYYHTYLENSYNVLPQEFHDHQQKEYFG